MAFSVNRIPDMSARQGTIRLRRRIPNDGSRVPARSVHAGQPGVPNGERLTAPIDSASRCARRGSSLNGQNGQLSQGHDSDWMSRPDLQGGILHRLVTLEARSASECRRDRWRGVKLRVRVVAPEVEEVGSGEVLDDERFTRVLLVEWRFEADCSVAVANDGVVEAL